MAAGAEIQIILSPAGEEMVVLPRARYEQLVALEEEEEAELIAILDARKAEIAASPHPYLPAEITPMVLKGATALEALRRWRGLTQTNLAAKAGVGQGYISDIENRRRKGSAKTLAALAAALDVPGEWLG